MKNLILLAGLILFSSVGLSKNALVFQQKNNKDLEKKIDSLMQHYSDKSPGAVVGVTKKGKLIFSKAYGLANLNYDIKLNSNSRINIGSISKQFTAFGIGLLKAKGKLSYDDDIRKYLPIIKKFEHTITIRHLLTHTSGLREFLNTLELGGRQLTRGDYAHRKEVLRIVNNQPKLQSVPGAVWLYNNTGYLLLTMIIESITKQPFQQYMNNEVFKPLGMNDTQFRTDNSQVIKNRAIGYYQDRNGTYHESADYSGAMGAGGLYSTAEDFAKWMDNFRKGKLGGKELIKEMTTMYVLSNGKDSGYGLGMYLIDHNGLKRFMHGGADISHRSLMSYYPSGEIGIFVFSNTTAHFQRYSDMIAEIVLKDEMDKAKMKLNASNAAGKNNLKNTKPFDFNALSGRFKFVTSSSDFVTFSKEGGELFVKFSGGNKRKIELINNSTLNMVGTANNFVLSSTAEDQKIQKISFHMKKGIAYLERTEVKPWNPSVSDLRDYVGKYYSEELDVFYEVQLENNKLLVYQSRLGDIFLNPVSKHFFSGYYPVIEVRFNTNQQGFVKEMIVDSGRTLGVVFTKTEQKW